MQSSKIERRSCERFGTYLEGRVIAANGRAVRGCIVRDLSATGARILFPDPVEVPVEFTLEIPLENATAKAHLVWFSGHEYGIAFAD